MRHEHFALIVLIGHGLIHFPRSFISSWAIFGLASA
jgi:hypothetical protein